MNIPTSTTERTPFTTRSSSPAEHLSSVKMQRGQGVLWTLSFLPPLLLGALILLSWYASTTYGHVNSLILPPPDEVFASLREGISSGLYWSHILTTLQESMLGFLLALLIALPIGYGVAKSRFLATTLQPYLAAGQAIPVIVLAPFLFIWIGPGMFSVILICMLVVLFPLVVNTILGIRTLSPELLDAARLEGAAGWSLLAHIEFPLALPAILAAVRTSLTLSITGAIVGEFVVSPDRGLGALVQIASRQYNTAFMFATVLVLALLAALYYSLTWLLVKLAETVY